MNNIYAVIVTYANRYHYLEQVMDACRAAGTYKIVVVDNNSACCSKRKLSKYSDKHSDIHILHFSTNLGSAGGYKKGMEYCYSKKQCGYIWLLDDDNQPHHNALDKLYVYYINHIKKKELKQSALLSYREDRPLYKEAIMKKRPDLMIGKTNNFLGFHTTELAKKIYHRLGFFKEKSDEKTNVTTGEVLVAPYGGLFFHKQLLNTIGYPDESFFVYGDDFDFTLRITKKGGRIILITESILEDLEQSFHTKQGLLTSKVTNATNSSQCYYMTRNNIRFGTQFIKNKFIYYANAIIYNLLTILLVTASFKIQSVKNYISFLKGEYDGFSR